MDRLDCEHARPLIDAAVDGELDLLTQMAFDAHLATCEACAAAHAERIELVSRLRQGADRFAAPAALRTRLLAGLPATATPIPVAKRWTTPWQWGAWVGSVAALAASVVLFLATPNPGDQLGRDLVAAHIRSLIPDHLTDIPSSDKHNVKPWFNGRAPLSPPVPNLTADGFPLLGGRLDYVDEHMVAALVYHRSQHIINLFVWAAPDAADHVVQVSGHNGYNLLEWTKDGVAYAAISDLNLPELKSFQHLWSIQAAQDEGQSGGPASP